MGSVAERAEGRGHRSEISARSQTLYSIWERIARETLFSLPDNVLIRRDWARGVDVLEGPANDPPGR
jgi:hypothetical protein